jgi:ABC-type methionine transport system ATPase subunit
MGNTMVVIEHNLDIIKSADHVIDLGPEGGPGGGRIVASGTVQEVAQNEQSYTGQFLKKILDESTDGKRTERRLSPFFNRRGKCAVSLFYFLC